MGYSGSLRIQQSPVERFNIVNSLPEGTSEVEPD